VNVRPLLTGLLFALGAVAIVLAVVLPAFFLVNLLYDDGNGLTPLLIGTVAVWGLLAWLLRRRRVHL
jgi:cytochrome c biogenesis protein CcdA